MALELTLPFENPVTGTRGSDIKPITEGERATVVPDQKSSSPFSFLDDVFTTAQNSASQLLGAVAQREVDRLVNGPEARVTSEGDPTANNQNVNPGKDPKPFIQQYKTELMIGGAVVAGMVVLLIVTRD